MSIKRGKLGGVQKTVITLVSCVIVFGILAATLMHVSVKDIFVFLLFQLLCVSLPGIALLRLLKIELTNLEKLVTAYGLGLLFNILLYFLLAPFSLSGAIRYVSFAQIAVSAAVIAFTGKHKAKRIHWRRELTIALVFSSFFCLLTFILLSLANLTPDIAGARVYHHDLTNGISLITSASFGFPMEFLQMSYTPHYYHPFFYAYCAVMKHCTNFSSFDIGTKYSLITIAPFFASAFIALTRRIFIKSASIIISAVSVTVFFFPVIYYVTVDLLGFSLSIAFACCAVFFYLKAEKIYGKFFNRYHVISMLFLLGCLGAKGSNGVTVLFALCFSLLFVLIRRKALLRVVSAGLLYSVPFFILYFLLYRQGAESMYFRGELMLNQRINYFALTPESWPVWLKVFLANAMFTINFNRILIICFVILLVSVIVLKKRLSPLVDVALGALICGIVMSNLFFQYGSSEIYFLYTAIPFAVSAGIYCIGRLASSFKKKAKTVFILACSLVLIPVLSFEAYDTFKNAGYFLKDAYTYSPLNGNRKFTGEQLSETVQSKRPAVITKSEYEGLIFIRDNTPKDSVICEGCYLIYNKYFYGSAFCERRFYLEGYGYVTMEDSNRNTPEKIKRDSVLSLFYGVEDESFVPLLRSYGIDYVIILQCQNKGWYFTNEYGSSTVFQNDEIAVYDIRAEETG